MALKVLLCGPASTLNLELEVRGKGFWAWAPRYEVKRRIGRKRSPELVQVALMPGFVFVQAKDAENLLVHKQRGGFRRRWSFMQYNGEVVDLTEEDVSGLRKVEVVLSLQQAQQPPKLAIGSRVTIIEGPFKGLLGTVTAWHRNHYAVELDKMSAPLRVSSFLIEPNQAVSG